MKKKISDYALIGDCETTALVNRSGAIEWLCWPRYDSEACFCALLGDEENGCWELAPEGEINATTRRYRPGTLILETRFETRDGRVRVTDFMPPRRETSDLIRIVTCESGKVRMRTRLGLRFDYGRRVPWIFQRDGNCLEHVAGSHAVLFHSPVRQETKNGWCLGSFDLAEGEEVAFSLRHFPSWLEQPPGPDPQPLLDETQTFWRGWSSRSQYDGRWKDDVERSLITLKALISRRTGGIVAAPTTSLPERPGGGRNWDYRYCWLRDATFVLLALAGCGYVEEAGAWRNWLLRAVAGTPEQIQPFYAVEGEQRLPEAELGWLSGFNGAKPVNIGNKAVQQLQLDLPGEVLDSLHQARQHGMPNSDASWSLQRSLVEFLEKCWQQPDNGFWEVRHDRLQFTQSKALVWVALDRAIRGFEQNGIDGPLDRWRKLRDRVHAEVCTKAYDEERGCFTRSYGSRDVDASLLMLPIVGFIPADDPRMKRTVEAIERELMVDGLLLRYDTQRSADGLPTGEGAFIACGFWYADNLILQGRREEAVEMFERQVSLANDVGLLAEEYDPGTRQMRGNFPQALSHHSLINTALNLTRSRGPAQKRAEK